MGSFVYNTQLILVCVLFFCRFGLSILRFVHLHDSSVVFQHPMVVITDPRFTEKGGGTPFLGVLHPNGFLGFFKDQCLDDSTHENPGEHATINSHGEKIDDCVFLCPLEPLHESAESFSHHTPPFVERLPTIHDIIYRLVCQVNL